MEKEINREKAQLEKLLTNLKSRRERLATIIEQHPHRHKAVSRSFEHERARGIERYSEKLENLNRKIQRVNLLMPTRNRQYASINRTEAISRFQKACPNL